MIGRIEGVLLEKQAPELLIDVQGLGYEVLVSLNTFFDLPALGEKVTLRTHFVVREDVQQLYGFADVRERELFRTLIKVSGVGPKMALAILKKYETDSPRQRLGADLFLKLHVKSIFSLWFAFCISWHHPKLSIS